MRSVLFALVALGGYAAASVTAQTTTTSTDSLVVNELSDPYDMACAPGLYPGFHTSEFRYDMPPESFFKIMGSFIHAEWYIGPLINSSGTDNVPGAIRTAKFNGAIYSDRLVGYARGPNQINIQFISAKPNIVFPSKPEPVTFGYYFEEHTITSICAGTATYVYFTARYCTNMPNEAYNIYATYQSTAMLAVADQLGANRIDGLCPLKDTPFKHFT